jgi:FAD dependent oxidoreductase TIGR03364
MATQVAIVGAGIAGLAQAWSAAERGHRVTVFERTAQATGASIRNFGMVWPIGMPAGEMYQTAMLGRRRWLRLAAEAGLWLLPCGSLHLAHFPDEWAVLNEFVERSNTTGIECELITPSAVAKLTPAAKQQGLIGAMFSPSEAVVNAREACAVLTKYLQDHHAVTFRFNTAINRVDSGRLTTAAGEVVSADEIIVCPGADFAHLFPQELRHSGMFVRKLQMLKTAPQPAGWRIGPHLAGGLTLRHYTTFADCTTVAALQRRVAAETPELDRYGIHVMASQNNYGEVLLGDSHEYDAEITPFEKAEIEHLMLRELAKIIELPHWDITLRWAGCYPKNPQGTHWQAAPFPGVTIINGMGGAGMTMSFGVAERFWSSR